MLLSTVLLFFIVLLYFGVVRRLNRIDRVLCRLGDGHFSVRAGLTGHDPLGRVGRRLDWAIERLAEERRKLLDSEERLKVALHGCDIAIWDWRLDSAQTYYSPRWKTLLGFAEDELPGQAEEWLRRVHPEDLAMVTAALDEHMSGGRELFVCEHRLKRKDGSYLWVQQSGVATRDEQGTVYRMIGALADISRRKEAEAALMRSREEYRSVVEGVTQIIFRSDRDGRITFLNPAWHELTGGSLDDALASRLQDCVHRDDLPQLRRFYQAVAERQWPSIACELRLACSGGRWRWFFLHARAIALGEQVLVAGVLSDIDAQKASEEALARSNRERDAILLLGPDGFVFVDESGRISFVNPAFTEMTGLRPDAVVGQTLSELDAQLASLCAASPGLALVDRDGDGLLQLNDPHKVVIRWLLRVLVDAGGEVHGRVIYLRDITHESEVDRMKSDFLSTAAHELRTPMASIFGFSELLLSREFDAATQRDLLQTIHRQTRNLINLVNELLDLSRIEARGGKSFKMHVQDLTPIVLNAVAAQYVPLETHKLEFDWPKKVPKVKVDGEKFQQCIINVLSNAIKYSPAGGVVRVTSRQGRRAGREMLGVAIADQGLGMTREQVARVFDRFYRADPSGAILGSGLGMSLVKEYMDIFGGEVEIASQPGQGTEVVLWLPVGEQNLEQVGEVA